MNRKQCNLAWILVVVSLSTAVVAQTPEDRNILTQARQVYYNLRTHGMEGFRCDLTPDWENLLQDERKTDPAKVDSAIQTLNQVHFVGSLGADGKFRITHNELTGQSREMNDALAQIYGGMQQMASGFYDTWQLFTVAIPLPEVESKYRLQTVGPLYLLSYKEGDAAVATTMTKDFAISEMSVDTPAFHSAIHPTFTKTGSGLLLSGYDAVYEAPGKPEESTHLNVLIDHQEVSGVMMLQKLDLRGTYGGSKFAVIIGFSGCQVTRK